MKLIKIVRHNAIFVDGNMIIQKELDQEASLILNYYNHLAANI